MSRSGEGDDQTYDVAEPTLSPSEVVDAVDTLPTNAPRQASDAGSVEESVPTLSPSRYELRGELGRGGMGRVLEAYDPQLRRLVAVKVLLGVREVSEAQLVRFNAEAQITSQLQHPAIVPVYDIGVTDEGVVFYVMKRIEGRTLRDILDAVHSGDPDAASKWSLHRLLTAFLRVCEAVSYAHARDVLHRDLKPDNIMLGPFGEVLVLDWGVAGLVGEARDALPTRGIRRATMPRTLDGALMGTPGYMSPEQLRGEIADLDGRSDVWSLGAILYELLTGKPAYQGQSLVDLFLAVMKGTPIAPRERAPHLAIAEEIERVCLQALATDREDRTPSVQTMADEVQAFLEGSRRRERALELVAQGLPMEQEAQAMRQRAKELRTEADALLREIPPHSPVQAKAPAWSLQDEAARLQEESERKVLEFRQLMRTALNFAPELPEPRMHLAANYHRLHVRAEKDGDRQLARVYETMIRMYQRGEYDTYLEGTGRLSLASRPAGARALLYRYVERERRLQEVFVADLGPTPVDMELAMGSYIVEMRLEGHHPVRYPLCIGRNEHWDGVPPGGSATSPVLLPSQGTLGPDDCYVPEGWFWAGGDPAVSSFARRRYWADAFVVKRFPVTNAEYMVFLDALVDAGREAEALQYVPRERSGTKDDLGTIIYGRDASGHFHLRPDADGDLWLPDWPVMMVDRKGAGAYAQWRGEVDQHPWRLPFELEWEKAARGVDGRPYPWGATLDPSWVFMRESHTARPLVTSVESFPVDCSPYGVRGLGGNVSDWCADVYSQDTPEGQSVRHDSSALEEDAGGYVCQRGGAWNVPADACRAARRVGATPLSREYDLGFRLVRSQSG